MKPVIGIVLKTQLPRIGVQSLEECQLPGTEKVANLTLLVCAERGKPSHLIRWRVREVLASKWRQAERPQKHITGRIGVYAPTSNGAHLGPVVCP